MLRDQLCGDASILAAPRPPFLLTKKAAAPPPCWECARIDWGTTRISVMLSVPERRRYRGYEKITPTSR